MSEILAYIAISFLNVLNFTFLLNIIAPNYGCKIATGGLSVSKQEDHQVTQTTSKVRLLWNILP